VELVDFDPDTPELVEALTMSGLVKAFSYWAEPATNFKPSPLFLR